MASCGRLAIGLPGARRLPLVARVAQTLASIETSHVCCRTSVMTLSDKPAMMDRRMKQAAREGTMAHTETRNEKLDLRLTPSAKRTLRTAALAAHRSVSEFVLESALARAEETLPDRQRFGLRA